MDALGRDVVIVNSTGCIEINSSQYPNSAWRVPYIHSLFDNAPSVASGIVNALRAKGNSHTQVVIYGGDGSLYDISFGALSAAWERGEDFLTICYNNEAYANTGVQRSGATPLHAVTTTTPLGSVRHGKLQERKALVEIAAAHGIPYAATASIGFIPDLRAKLAKASKIRGPRLLDIHAPCVINFGYEGALTIRMAKAALDTRAWPLYEVEDGVLRMNYDPKPAKSVKDYLAMQKRFAGLSAQDVVDIQKSIDARWDRLAQRAGNKTSEK
jgi:pyruvate ferredoxin oxidoreductase beta subunit